MTSHFGAFGKIPALGDFFRIGLPPAFTEPWDAWVQAGLLAAREAFGADWDGHYNSAPIWRFSLAANLAGAKPVQGVIMCSVDRVGRQFPLTLAAQCAEDVTPAEAHFAGADIFAALEAIALDALEDDATREQLATQLEALEPADPKPASLLWMDQALKSSGTSQTNLRDTLAASFLTSQYQNLSIWSADVNDTAYLLCHEGLPPPDWMLGLLDPARLAPNQEEAE